MIPPNDVQRRVLVAGLHRIMRYWYRYVTRYVAVVCSRTAGGESSFHFCLFLREILSFLGFQKSPLLLMAFYVTQFLQRRSQ